MNTDSVRDKNLFNFGSDTCKGGKQELVHSRKIIYYRDRDKNDRLVSQDVCGWWVARGIFQESYYSEMGNHLTEWSNKWWFDSQL